MADSCQPFQNQTLNPFRFYTIVLPVVLTILFCETIYVFSVLPSTFGNTLTIKGSLLK